MPKGQMRAGQRLPEHHNSCSLYRVFSHDVTAAILVSQTSPLGVELFSYANAFFCSFFCCVDAGHVSENTL